MVLAVAIALSFTYPLKYCAMSSFKSAWYLIYTKPRHEKKVASSLSQAGVEFFLPTSKKLKIWFDRKKYIEEPLFPSYIFVRIKSMYDYYQALNIEGVLYYVKLGKDIAPVSETVISNLKLLVGEGEDIEISTSYFKPGQKLAIQRGSLTGLTCEVVQCNGIKKLLVRVCLLQRNLLIKLPADSLMAISA
jgi:transcriptional antiterminator RfaH